MPRRPSPGEDRAVEIRIEIEDVEPPSGIASAEGRPPVRFTGWLELLRVLSDLLGLAPH